MIRACAWCEREGRPDSILGEVEPFDDLRMTHGTCDEHKESTLRAAASNASEAAKERFIIWPDLYREHGEAGA